MRNHILRLSLVTGLALAASTAVASLGTPLSNLVMDKTVVCLHNDFEYLHNDIADFLGRSLGPAIAAVVLESETKDLPALLRNYRFFDEAAMVDREIKFTSYYCVVNDKRT